MGNREVIQRLHNFNILWPKQIGLAVKKSQDICVAYAKAHHFYMDITHKLTDNIKALNPHFLGHLIRGEIVAETDYAIYVEEGTRPHPINSAVFIHQIGWRYIKIHPGSRKHRFLSRALLANEGNIKKEINNAWTGARRMAGIH